MKTNRFVVTMLLFTLFLLAGVGISVGAQDVQSANNSSLVCDRLWVWGNPEMAEQGSHTLATFAQAGPAERAALLGTPNIVMAGNGLPADDAQALALTAEVAKAPRLVWEVSCDDANGGPPFEYPKTAARIALLAKQYPQIEAVLLDDMSSVKIEHGFKPEHIRALHTALDTTCPAVRVWGVVYSMNFEIPNINDYIRELDVVNLWIWHAKDVVNIEKYVARLEKDFPGKPIVLGLYLYDYGENRAMPADLQQTECATALTLLQAGRIRDIVFLTINNDEGAVSQAAKWVQEEGAKPLTGTAPADQAAPAPASETTPVPLTPPPTSTSGALSMRDMASWRVTYDGWKEDDEGVIRPPDVRNLHSRAFYVGEAYADLDAEFEFNGNYRETGTGMAGFMLHAQDSNHFYLLHFPWGGQQLRAKHFWAALAKVEGDGYLRNIAAEWVPGVPSETGRWYHVRVAVQGLEIRVWVDGREALIVHDDTYASGRVGLTGYGWYSFRNVRVTGQPVQPPAWDETQKIPTHAFNIGLSSEQMPCSCIAPNGDVLVAAGNQLVRSKDKGRTWGPPETLPETLGVVTDYGNGMFSTPKGRLAVMLYRDQKTTGGPVPEIAMADSTDNGVTWSAPVPATVAEGWPAIPASLVPYGPVTINADGVLMRFLLGGAKDENATFTDVRTWSATHCRAFVIRSADDGKTWSAPIELDRPSWTDAERGTIPGSLDFTEPAAVVMGNTVTALIRPVYSPYMWQCWSYDGGATWDAASRATFPGYAESMTRTTSGVILCAHRFPLYSVNISRDGGLNWDAGTVIDYPVWAMGTMLEVEPDVVLCTYMNAERSQPLLAQLVRVTAERIEPVSEGK